MCVGVGVCKWCEYEREREEVDDRTENEKNGKKC